MPPRDQLRKPTACLVKRLVRDAVQVFGGALCFTTAREVLTLADKKTIQLP